VGTNSEGASVGALAPLRIVQVWFFVDILTLT